MVIETDGNRIDIEAIAVRHVRLGQVGARQREELLERYPISGLAIGVPVLDWVRSRPARKRPGIASDLRSGRNTVQCRRDLLAGESLISRVDPAEVDEYRGDGGAVSDTAK